MTVDPSELVQNTPPKGFLSDILAEEEAFLAQKNNKAKPKQKVEIDSPPPQGVYTAEDSVPLTSLDLGQAGDDELFNILNAPPHYYVFNSIPQILVPNFPNVKKMYFGVKMIDTARTMPNGTMQPIKIHKMFMALLIDPPKYEDVVKSHEATAHESSFGYNLTQECYYRWNLLIQNNPAYREYLLKCEGFGIKFIMNYSDFHIVNSLETDVREI